jgi:hypothetical protein
MTRTAKKQHMAAAKMQPRMAMLLLVEKESPMYMEKNNAMRAIASSMEINWPLLIVI